MHNLDLILTLTGGLAAALVCGYLTQQVRLSPIVGYLLAGVLIGPYTPGFSANRELAEQLAEVGVILLMFGVGLHFHLDELLAVRRIAIPGAVGQSLVATMLGVAAGWAFGWGWSAGLVYGLAISVASTVVLVRILADNNDLHTPTGHIAVGWLVVEDLFTVVVLVLLPALFQGAPSESRPLPLELGLALVKIAALVAFTFLVGGRVVPWLLRRIADTRSRELFTLTILVVALGIAVGSAKIFGVSMALGAFLAGMVVGRSEFSLRAAAEALPMRDAFAVLFFVSTGMLFDPFAVPRTPAVVLVTLAIIVVGKPLAAFAIVALLKYPLKVALAVAVALAQIGEFSFILAALGQDLGILSDRANNGLIGAAIVSISLNPLLYLAVDPIESWASRNSRLWRRLNARARKATIVAAKTEEEPRDASHRAVVVGFGPVGRTVTRLLRENEVEPTVIELNIDTVHSLRGQGVAAVYGDATHIDVLRAAGVPHAATLIMSASGIKGSQQIIRVARELNPEIRILARSDYLREAPPLRHAGAERVFSAEAEIALALTEEILRRLGATPDQIDRERDRVRTDISAPYNLPPSESGSLVASGERDSRPAVP
jgi:CPA2 family monovalent cation:H+ antiporter-2